MQELAVTATQPACNSTHSLFLERLDAFCMAEIRAFAEREQMGFSETRRHVAEWHSRYLFRSPNTESPVPSQDRVARVNSVLADASRILESLCDTSGVQSFLLAVDPSDPISSGFLGGSVLGREFWRGQRGGGDAGAKAFKLHCFKNTPPPSTPENAQASSSKLSARPPLPKVSSSRSMKADLYEAVRKALRSASGVRNAEMKWTNPALLHTYGVDLVGWPPHIPAQNPSSLKADQNKELLEALESGTMHFVRTVVTRNQPPVAEQTPSPVPVPSIAEEDSMLFTWAIQYDDQAAQSDGTPGGPYPSATDSMGSPDPALDTRSSKRQRVEE
ncbi:hypothetical protein R3P38DRAFT_2921007 [Favolaschia claudopus]|uniref:Uncharacterized protein n=1 Tax=Favolaschia claudopus TaxID=2862362 RepID=A0AAW0C3H2_9AGAR